MSIGRPKQFDTEKALHAAMEQFWLTGFEATSLQDLLKSTRLSKSSLYQTFGNKHKLFLSCIAEYQRLHSQEMSKQLDQSASALEFVERFLHDVVAEADRVATKKGCLLINTINECAQHDPEIAHSVNNGMINIAKVLAKAIERAKDEGDIATSIETDVLVTYLMTQVSGLRSMVKGGATKETLLSVVEVIKSSLQ